MKIKSIKVSYKDDILQGRYQAEKNDCTVRCYATAFDMSYATAHAKLKAAGRRDGKGFHFSSYLRGYHPELKRIEPKQTVATFLTQGLGQFGRYIVLISGHVFTTQDGANISDNYLRPGTRIKAVWKVESKQYIVVTNTGRELKFTSDKQAKLVAEAINQVSLESARIEVR